MSKETYVEHADMHYIFIVPVYVRYLYKTKTSTLNRERDYQKLSSLVNQLNDEDNKSVATTLKENGDMQIGSYQI